MRTVVTFGLAGALLVTMTACGGGADDVGGTAGSPVTASPSQSPSAATSTDASTDTLFDCGRFILGQGEEVQLGAAQCLIDAAGKGSPAELFVTRPTQEGDPIRFDYRVQDDGSVRIVTNTREDRFGNGEITAQVCRDPRIKGGRLDFVSCSTGAPASGPDPSVSSTAIPIPSRPPARPPKVPATVSPGPG